MKNSVSNHEKSVHGYKNQKDLGDLLSALLRKGYISDYQQRFRIGHPTTSNSQQFYAPFMIQFLDRTRWVIFSTTSMRTDRIKGQQWDAFNLKSLDVSITKAILAYSQQNKKKDIEEFKRQDAKYTSKNEITAIDRIFDFNELETKIKEEFYATIKEEIEVSDKPHSLATGQQWDKEGKSFEKYVSNILSSSRNFDFWKTGKIESKNIDYIYFKKLVDAFKLEPKNVKNITATADKKEIGYLPSGGSPKTDVLVEITNTNGEKYFVTVSCKRSKSNTVSVHQYTADTFADTLDSDNERLRKLLRDFQYCGNAESLPLGEAEELKKVLVPYLNKLVLWAIGGNGAKGKDKDDKKHLAQYIVTYQTKKHNFSVYSVLDYCNAISSKKCAFGTPFNWTYASKHRGKSIQLKAPIR